MMMKQLFKHTTSLLRTALLFGAIAFVNIPQVQAQYTTTYSGNPVHLTADMPDAFEAKTPVINDGEYYFIQFYEEITYAPFLFQSFLGEVGENAVMHAMDYLPYASNRLWTLVPGSDATHFKLKSKRGFYVKRRDDGFFITTSDPSQATDFERIARGSYRSGFCELRCSNGIIARRNGNTNTSEWQDMTTANNDNIHGKVRFAKLKANAAHIIYYRGEHADGYDNSQFRAHENTTRHYLTYSGADNGTVHTSVIQNGSMEGNNVSSFYVGLYGQGRQQATFTEGVGKDGSKCITITSNGGFNSDNQPINWDTQFFIRADDVIPIGTTFHVEFDYKVATGQTSTVGTQSHSEPGSYNHWDCIGDVSFTDEWQHFSANIQVSDAMGNGVGNDKNNSFQTIAFNLWTGTAITYYFDNVVLTVPKSSEVSSRRSIIPSDKSLWTLPTAAVYHQDGLWDLEYADGNGKFFIKKHNTEKYLNPSVIQYGNAVGGFYLGEKDNLSGIFSLEDPLANRYTRVQSLGTESLAREMFKNWDGYWANANEQGNATNWDFRFRLNEQLNSGDAVVGTDGVDYLTYADLSNYDKMTINGTPNTQLRVLMDRQMDNNNGPMVEKIVTIGSDGKAEVDLTNLVLNWDPNNRLTTQTGQATVRATYIDGYVNGDDDHRGRSIGEITAGNPIYCGNNKISGGNRVDLYNATWQSDAFIAYLQVDASNIPGTITKVTLTGDFKKISTNNRQMEYGVGYNNSPWSSGMTWNSADRSITLLGSTQKLPSQDGEEQLSFDITDAFTSDPSNMVKTILVYNLTAGNGYVKNPVVTVEYTPNKVSYAHLNAIKIGSGSGSVSSITLEKGAGNSSHLNHDQGDGSQAMLKTGNNTDDWYAGFYPVELPVSLKDEFFQVRLVLKVNAAPEGKQTIMIGEGMSDSGMTRDLLPGVSTASGYGVVGAKYTPSSGTEGTFKNCFKITNLAVPSGYDRIIVRFASPVSGDWQINGIVNGNNGAGAGGGSFESIVNSSHYYKMENSTYYEMDLRTNPNDPNTVVSTVSELSIFSGGGTCDPLTIAEVYFYKGSMISNGSGFAMRSSEGNPSLWELEQVDDYRTFRLKNPDTSCYLAGIGEMTEPNDPYGEAYENANEAETYENWKFWEHFTPKWYIPTENAEKEIRVNHYVRHTESYLRKYAASINTLEGQEEIRRQGLATDVDSEWWNFDDNGFEDEFDVKKGTQKVNHFEITHYLKKGSSRVIEFPTVLNRNNDHIFFQRFYHYGEKDTEMDLDNLKAHVSLDTRDDGDVQYFLYNNGMVTGQKLDWRTYDSSTQTYTAIPDGGMSRNEQRRFNFTNSDGQSFIVAVDVSRYSDLKYLNNPDHLAGDLREPSLTMRYLFHMNDANDMAKTLTACTEGSDKWLEQKEIHFGRTQVPYTKFKKVGYRGEFLGIRHIFSDYWVYNDPQLADDSYLATLRQTMTEDAIKELLEQNLVSAVNDNNSGKIEVVLEPGNTGIRRGGYNAFLASTLTDGLNNEEYDDSSDDESNYQGFYFYDKLSPSPKTEYGNSRFVVFRYPANSIVSNCGPENPAYLKVYLNNNGTRYQIAKFTLIFDANMATRPWTKVKNGTHYANGVDCVKGSSRDPNNLRAIAGHPIAKVSFDFPQNITYKFPTSGDCPNTDGVTKHDGGNFAAGGEIANSSPIPLTFGHTNYSFDGNSCNWGSYALVTEKNTTWGNDKIVKPADDAVYGYNLPADDGMQKAFMYIDASEQPGDICAVDFEGEFCANDKLMCSGWISGSNKIRNDTRCPGSITLTVKGEDEFGNSQTIYRFCPGQIYELDDGYGHDGYVQGETPDTSTEVGSGGIDGSINGGHVVWQQFYFEFSTDQKYKRYWLEVNNNCVSSNGGDFMLDNVEVYTIVPEVEPEINTPLCVKLDSDGNTVTEMRLLKLKINFNKLISSRSDLDPDGTDEEGFVILEKYKFLDKFKKELKQWADHLTAAEKVTYGITGYDFENMPLDTLAAYIEKGKLKELPTDNGSAYKKAFDHAIIGNQTTWHSDTPGSNMNSSIMYFRWSSTFEDDDYQPIYSFAKAVNKTSPVYRETDKDGENWIIFNGNYPELNWKTDTDYYIINTSTVIGEGTYDAQGHYNPANPCDAFNLLSECAKATTFRIDPPYHVLGLESSESTTDHVVCEGQIPTISLELKGFDLKGEEVDMTGLNYDWWLGNKSASNPEDQLATLANYHAQKKTIGGVEVRLDEALATLRAYYPAVTSLYGIIPQTDANPFLTQGMIDYLKEVVAAGELVLHQTTISVPAEKASDEDPYFYIVACPIHDEAFSQALNPAANEYVAYFCDEPQGLRIKVGQKAPTLMTGFVPGEHNFDTYDYAFPEGTNPVLSIRLAKAAQFETVKNDATEVTTASTTVNHLWLPIRNAVTQTASGVIKKSDDDNVYLASSNDPTWDRKISKQMTQYNSLPVVGRIVRLEAINTSGGTNIAAQKDANRLCVYFTKDFEVREGYNYTLSLPFEEEGDVNTCDGTILINLKIVPDYEVWTGGAGNDEWNNDENWRRADGNTTISNAYYGDELYRANGAVNDEDSPLHEYVTNKANYYSSNKNSNNPSSDQILRKGFAPLYCTHVLMKSDEWGNAPELYDPLDYEKVATHEFTNEPFPNLRETATPILKFDMQARRYDMWEDTYGEPADRGTKDGDLIAEMYQMNSCDEIAFQPGTELLDAHLLNYNTAWVEYQLDAKRWYLLGSPLQGTIAGEWYAPTGNSPQQKTTYYDAVKFGAGYDRYSPAIYQRSWDKAKAVLYEVGSTYSTGDNPDDLQLDNNGTLPGSEQQGIWNGATWNTAGADEYLDRLGYKPLGNNKANVAIQGIWSNTYNDATVDYTKGGFSVMVMNHLKGNAGDVQAIVRLPKEDTMYDYYKFSETGAADGGTDTDLEDVRDELERNLNRGRLKTDLLLPTSTNKLEDTDDKFGDLRYGTERTITRIPIHENALQTMNTSYRNHTEAVSAGVSNLGYYLVENPFNCGLDMNAFFAENTGLEKKYWLLTATGQHLVQRAADGEWITSDGTNFGTGKEYPDPEDNTNTLTFYPYAVLAPGQGFFVQATTPGESTTITFNKDMQVRSRFGVIDGEGSEFEVVVGQSQRTKLMYDANNDGIPDTDAPDGKVEGDIIMIDTDGDNETDTPTPVVVVPVYNEVAVDLNGNGINGELHVLIDGEYVDEIDRQPVLDDITETVTIYKYKKETLTIPDDPTTQDEDESETIDKTRPLRAPSRGVEASDLAGLVITAQRGNNRSSALVMKRDGASNDFLPSEDTETFITSDLQNVPTVYTLCGRLATTINSIRDFRCLPLGVESSSDAPCTLTFNGVELLGDSISFYDAVERKLTPLESGMKLTVSGQTQNRYYLVHTLIQEEAAEETHLQVFIKGKTVKVIASTDEPILSVSAYNVGGSQVHTASPQAPEYSFDLPGAGVYLIKAETEEDHKVIKVIAR